MSSVKVSRKRRYEGMLRRNGCQNDQNKSIIQLNNIQKPVFQISFNMQKTKTQIPKLSQPTIQP
nr:MAG TPA: hypothetical protein [Caudoviricetes sp.]